MKKIHILTLCLLASLQSFAGPKLLEIDISTINSQFFVAILAGVLIAIVFQIVLTALSVALGITMIGDVKQSYVDSKVYPEKNTDDNEYVYDQEYSNDGPPVGVKISSAFGIWSLLTTALSLFGASALALNLSFFGSVASNITVALAIWALFFLVIFYLETKIVNTVIGGLVTTATSGLKTSANMMKGLFTKSENEKTQQTINHAIDKVRKEFDFDFDTSKLSDVLSNFLDKVDNKMPNYDTLKSDLEAIAKKSKSKNTSAKFMAIQQVLTKAIDKADGDSNTQSADKVEQAKKILSELKEAYQNDNSALENVKDLATKYTSLEKSQIEEKVKEVEQRILSETPDSFSKEDLNKIQSDPSAVSSMLLNNLDDLDKNKIIDILSKHTSLEKNQLYSYAEKLDSVISRTKKVVEENDIDTVKASAEESVANFFNSTNKPELNYADLKKDVYRIFDNPKDSLSVIKSRINKMDNGTIKALVTNNPYIDEKDVDSISYQIEDAVQTLRTKVTSIEQKATSQLEMAKRKAVIKAEHARKTAASAAWWLVISVVFAGGAAILGAMLELA